jgi:hypothetical protein
MNNNFKRENRYIVIKIADLVDTTGLPMQPSIEAYMKQAQEVRESAGKPHLECLVIESDWPEYEPAWKMIQDRVEGNKSNFDDWHNNPYTKILMDSIKNDYVPKAYQAAAPIDNGMPSDTEMMFNQMQFGADMVTKYSNACKEVKRLSELHTAIRESIIRIIDGNYVVPQEVRGEIYCIKNITGEALFPDTQAKKGE